MSFDTLSLLLDILVLGALGATIFYALRLSKSLENFKKYRESLGGVIQDLSKNINRAEEAIQKLRNDSAKTADDLQELIDDARLMADELQLINETGDALATRLENAAQRSGAMAKPEDLKRAEAVSSYDPNEYLGSKKTEGDAGFFIQDRDFDAPPAARQDQNEVGKLQSQAEKELYEALQRNKKMGEG